MIGHLFDLIPDALVLVDDAGRILQSNAQADAMFGYPGGLAGASVDDLLPDDARKRHREHRASYAAAPRVRPMGAGFQPLLGCRRDGSVFPVEIALSPVDPSSQRRYLASVRDISGSIRERQRVARARHDRLVAHVGELALIARSEAEIVAGLPEKIAEALGIEAVLVLSSWPTMPGHPPARRVAAFPETIGSAATADLFDPILLSTTTTVFGDLAAETPPKLLRSGWSEGFRSAALVPLFEWNQTVGVIVALSARLHHFEHDAVHCLKSVANLLAAFLQRRQAEERLAHAQQLEAVGQLTGGVAHDFNNLLTVLSGNLQLIELQGSFAPPMAELLDSMRHAVDNGVALTAKLLTLSRRQSLSPRVIDPRNLLASLGAVLSRTLRENIRVGASCLPYAPAIFADGPQLESALLNLCFNARDAMPRGGRLTITACGIVLGAAAARLELEPGEYLQVSVQDTGVGMAPEVLARALEPFFTTKESGRGNGLGLSTVYGFVRQSGGQVRMSSRLGYGTCVDLYLPSAAADADDGQQARLTVGPAPVAAGETLLVVEDDTAVLAVAVAFLESLGYVVRSAADADGALAWLKKEPAIALLFVDVALGPGLSGIELAALARRRRPDLCVLLTSGHDASVGTMDDALLSKPYRRQDLADAIRRQFDGRAGARRHRR